MMRKIIWRLCFAFFSLITIAHCLPSKSTKYDASKDPEIFMTPPEIVRRWGYPSEQYNVTTEDGYILTVFRVPHSRNVNATPTGQRPVVFLQHGLESSSADWVENLPNEAAAYLLADAGFDVWMGNFRGNTYSKHHVTLTPKDHTFWQFSWDEMAHYDLPAMVNFVIEKTDARTLYYIGHSMGTQTAFAKFSQDKTFGKKIQRFYALAPVTTVEYIKGPIRFIARFTHALQDLFKLVGIDEFLPNDFLMEELAKYFCGNPVTDLVCENICFLIAGPESKQLNATRVPVYVAHTPAGTSTQNMIHYGQMVSSGKFCMYDYGRRENVKRYGQDTPPAYDVGEMETPVFIFWGSADWLADMKDVEPLIPKLRNVVGNVFLNDFNHLDFIWGLRAAAEIYFPIIYDIRNDFATRFPHIKI